MTGSCHHRGRRSQYCSLAGIPDETRRAMTCGVARDGEAVLEAIEQRPPDVLLLDLMMPKRNGYEVCDAVRANPAFTKIHILMLTAKGQEVERAKGLALGADDYITKPFSTREVVERVRQVMAGSGACLMAKGRSRRAPPRNRSVACSWPSAWVTLVACARSRPWHKPGARSVSLGRGCSSLLTGEGRPAGCWSAAWLARWTGSDATSPLSRATIRTRASGDFPHAWLGRLPESWRRCKRVWRRTRRD